MTKTAIREAFEHLRAGRGDAAARGGRPLALRGRLARRHERDARGLDPAARRVRRRRLARPRADADARARRSPRAGDPRLRPRAVLARRGARSPPTGERLYSGRYLGGKRIKEDEATTIVARRRPGQPGTITKLEKKEEREAPQLLYDLTSLQRHANTLFGFSARRTLAAAQRLYEEHKAITYPRTNSRFLTSDMIGEIKPTAAHRRPARSATRRAPPYVTRLEKLPLGRVVNDKQVEDHHAIIPTRSEHDLEKMGTDESRDLRPRRQALPGRLPPGGGLRAHARRDDRRRARLPHVAAASCSRPAGRPSTARRRTKPGDEDDSGGDQLAAARSSRARTSRRARSSRSARRRSRRGASRRRRSSARWRPPARTSRTPSCARR